MKYEKTNREYVSPVLGVYLAYSNVRLQHYIIYILFYLLLHSGAGGAAFS